MASPAPVRGARILVVEDEPLVAQVLADMLALDDHVVDVAANGRLALEMIEKQAYDLILTDLHMPELDGVGFYRELQQRHPRLRRRVAFVSGSTGLPESADFVAEADLPILTKPFRMGDLSRITQRMLSAP
jgi:CheY-like chemotaxis protein